MLKKIFCLKQTKRQMKTAVCQPPLPIMLLQNAVV